MKVRILSDLHLEHTGQRWRFIDGLDNSCDVLVLAGDIDSCLDVDRSLDMFCEKFSTVIYVPGNHEYFMSSPDKVHDILSVTGDKNDNLHYLHPESPTVEINGRTFHGSTWWFRDDPLSIHYERNMGDFNRISGFKPWVYEQQAKFQRHLEENLTEGDIVITHHIPSEFCVAKEWKGSMLNRFFVCDHTDLILDRKPALWLFGHTHTSFDDTLGSTRLICNPRGYPREPSGQLFDRLKEVVL